MQLRALTWNLFHGRDFPPDPALFTLRSRLLRTTERDATHVQVNRDLFGAFSEILAGAEWDVALLQETPPRWSTRLAAACDAQPHRALTSRNWFLPITSALARFNPDLIASWEGGSNLTLVRAGEILERRTLVLTRLPERRVMAFTRLKSGACIANLHASTTDSKAEQELGVAAVLATEWAAGRPLLLGGDFNLRPAASPLFAKLAERGFSAPTSPDSIDHLLGLRADVLEPPTAWPRPARELPWDGLRLTASDHAPVVGVFAF